MRARPVRPNIFLPVVRFGVADSDWFTVLLISCAGYLAPVPFGLTVLYVPLQMWTWLLTTAGSIAFFNYIRIGRKPFWLQHKLKSLFLHHHQYRAIPNGTKQPFNRPWIVTGDRAQESPTLTRTPSVIRMMEDNGRIQDAWEQKCKTLWLTTN
jgi:hypothetical protein